MSNAGGPSDGVVRNSALSFVAPAQAQAISTDATVRPTAGTDLNQDRLVPPGLKALYDACSALYPDQPNPLQVTTRLKYWLGGHDPLDYISMYWHPGVPEENVPPHWHYVSFGLSDLHGDGRVHPPPDRVSVTPDTVSGYGFELTTRVTGTPDAPPLWPAALLQALATYVFTTGNKFCAGDHVSWHAPLDGATSKLRHLLVAADPRFTTVDTPHGLVTFLQIVGCTSKELRAAQRGSGFDVLKLIAEDTSCGGSWLVTCPARRASARRVRVCNLQTPADLAGVSAPIRWQFWRPPNAEDRTDHELSPTVERQIKETLQRGLNNMSTDRSGPEGHTMSTDSFEMSSIERALPQIPEIMQGSWRDGSVEYLDGVQLSFNAEGASLLPLAIDGRVRHGRHFTWRFHGRALSLLSPKVAGAAATINRPYALLDTWLQVLIPDELARDMSEKLSCLARLSETDSESDEEGHQKKEPVKLPFTVSWSEHRIKITVVNDLL